MQSGEEPHTRALLGYGLRQSQGAELDAHPRHELMPMVSARAREPFCVTPPRPPG